MGQLSQGSGRHSPRDCWLVCRSPLSEVSTVAWMASALAPSRESRPEKCALSHGSGVLASDPRDSCRFWSPHVEKVCTVTQFRLGGGGGEIPLGGGGVGEPRTGIIYALVISIIQLLQKWGQYLKLGV